MRTNAGPVSRLGPGLVFAAAAVGTSHIVQATRAGATYGLTLALVIIAICLIKYPLFRFAADYAAATGESLVAGYRRRGRWLVGLMLAASAVEAVAATAGVSLVSAAILLWMFQLSLQVSVVAVGLLALTAVVVSVGSYRLLESLTGILVATFSLLTLLATAASLPSLLDVPAGAGGLLPAFPLTRENVSFAVAVSGWMPIGNTAAIMLAAWIVGRNRTAPRSLAAARFDFNLGYWASTVLALCFLIIGAAVLHGRDGPLPAPAGAFIGSFVGSYAEVIGSWATPVVALTALAVMYSTLLAIVDGFPRLLGEFAAALRPGRSPATPGDDPEALAQRYYLPAMVIVVLGAGALLGLFLDGFAAFIDLVTIIGFLVAPVVALANQLVITAPNVPREARPEALLVRWNQLGIGLFAAATGVFLYLRF